MLNQSLANKSYHFKSAYIENATLNSEKDITYSLGIGYNRSGLYIINAVSDGVCYCDVLICQLFTTNTENNGVLTKLSSTHNFNNKIVEYGLWNGKLILCNRQTFPINVQVSYIG